MQKLLIKLLEVMGITAGDKIIIESIDNFLWRIDVPLGKIDGGVYEGKHWGDAIIEDTDAWLTFVVGNLYAPNEFNIGEGQVNLVYAAGNQGLAYTGELEDIVTARIKDLYNLKADGSEQGMQGDDYLSLDIWLDVDNIQDVHLTPEQMDDDEASENYLKQFDRFENHPGVTNGDLRSAVLAS